MASRLGRQNYCQKKPSARIRTTLGDIRGTRKRCLGMVRKLLTDARETSYWILSSRLTAECSTVELPGNAQRAYFHSITRSRIRHDLSVVIRLLTLLSYSGTSVFCSSCAALLKQDLGHGGQDLTRPHGYNLE